MSAFCAAIDWGTTRFRLWLLNDAGRVLDQVQTDDGLQSCIPDRFEAVVDQTLAGLGAPAGLPIVICGMAGSSSGWKQAPYVETPAGLDALALNSVQVSSPVRDIRIVPGVCQRSADAPDVIRGEETHLLGAHLTGHSNGLFCLPGTHSKWAHVDEGVLRDFKTFMTGELFDLLSTHSILKHTHGSVSAPDAPGFRTAVEEMLHDDTGLTGRLFSIRAANLLGQTTPDHSADRLSGLLIGSEVASVKRHYPEESQVFLIASGALEEAYHEALHLAGFSITTLPADDLVRAGLFSAACQFWKQADPELAPRAIGA
ncbi:MAG: 2-dehydro-3-deoxygalactonokinase [Pseudomonadota bacterium]